MLIKYKNCRLITRNGRPISPERVKVIFDAYIPFLLIKERFISSFINPNKNFLSLSMGFHSEVMNISRKCCGDVLIYFLYRQILLLCIMNVRANTWNQLTYFVIKLQFNIYLWIFSLEIFLLVEPLLKLVTIIFMKKIKHIQDDKFLLNN